MMKKRTRKLLSSFLTLVFLLSAVQFCVIPAAAAAAAKSGISSSLHRLESKYADGTYWNHLVRSSDINGDNLLKAWKVGNRAFAEQFADTISNTACSTHNGTCPVGFYDCNVFDGGMQCWGFARKVFYDLFGVRCSDLGKRTDIANVKAGDYVRFGSDANGHSFIVTERTGNIVTVVECNFYGKDLISWGRKFDITQSVNGMSFSYYYRAPNYDEVNRAPLGIVPGAAYALTPQCAPGLRLDVQQGSVDSEANIQIYEANGTLAQQFEIRFVSERYFMVVSKISGMPIDVQWGGQDAGTNVWQYTSNCSDAQLWELIDAGSGFVYIVSKLNPNLYLDVSNAGSTNGTNVQVWWRNESNAQKWRLDVCY